MKSITAVGFDMDYTLAQARPSRAKPLLPRMRVLVPIRHGISVAALTWVPPATSSVHP